MDTELQSLKDLLRREEVEYVLYKCVLREAVEYIYIYVP